MPSFPEPPSLYAQSRGVTIGIPAHNEERFIEQAIRSAAPQCEHLIISDNASTDGTEEICSRLSHEFANITYIRQQTNVGATANFRFLLDACTTPYFMWFGAHDILPHDYVSTLNAALEEYPTAVLAFGDARHIDIEGQFVRMYRYVYGTSLAAQTPATRLLATLRYLTNCSLLHGLARTGSLREAWLDVTYLAGDKVFLANLVLSGPFVHVPSTCLHRRDAHPVDSLEAQLTRITARTSEENVTLGQMQSSQLALATEASRGMGLEGVKLRILARAYLVKRYGPFSSSPMMWRLESAAHGLLPVLRRLRKLAHVSTK